jgi:hypothetical protein
VSITSVYGGRAAITFHEARHYYTVKVPGVVDKLWQPSVTGIIGMMDKSGALVPWAVDTMAQRIKQLTPAGSTDKEVFLGIVDAAQETWRQAKNDAADIGSLAHRVLEQELLYRAGQAEKPNLPIKHDSLLAPNLTEEMVEKANNSIQAGIEFFNTHHMELVFTERVLWSPTFGYLGTTDGIAHIDGKLSVFDFKTSKRLYPTVWLQLAAYQKAYEEEFPEQQVVQRVGINIGRDGILETDTRDNVTLSDDFTTFRALLKTWRWNMENQGKYSKPAPQILGALPQALAAAK